ncbi:beta-lactamase family protein [bacterium]|nr:beta-lactamase family protein [bacterium]
MMLVMGVFWAGAVTAAEPPELEGDYLLAPDTVFSITRAGPRLYGCLTGWATPEVMQASASTWYLPAYDTTLRFRREAGKGAPHPLVERYRETAMGRPTGGSHCAWPTGVSVEARLLRAIPAYMARYHCPAVSLAIIRQRAIVWHHEFGVQAATRPVRIDENTVFEACSMGKALFAYRALMLVDAGRLDLDRPLNEYLTAPWAPEAPETAQITARMALQHTTGLPNWRSGRLRMVAPPGRRHTYSGEGITFLQRVVETLCGRPIDELMRDDLLQPLGMRRSSYRWREEYGANQALGHDPLGRCRAGRRFLRANAASTLYSTPLDFARYLLLMMDPRPPAALAISHQLRNEMLSPRALPSGQVTFGLGWELYRESGERICYVFHVGANKGFRCQARFYPETGDGLVIMTNSDNGRDLYERVIEMVFPSSIPRAGH